MLLVLIALQMASSASGHRPATATVPAPRIQKMRVRLGNASRQPGALAVRLLPGCARTADCRDTDARQRYRLAGGGEAWVDRRTEMIRAAGPECGLTGMPVCPAKGRRMLRLAY